MDQPLSLFAGPAVVSRPTKGVAHAPTGAFARAAVAVGDRLADLLRAPIVVIDRREVIVAGNQPDLVGHTLARAGVTWRAAAIRIPVQLAGERGTVLMLEPHDGEVISPRLAQGLVDLVVSEVRATERPDTPELKDMFLHNLLHGQIEEEWKLLRQARILGLDLVPPRGVILIDAASYILGESDVSERDEAQARRRARVVIDAVVCFFHLPNDTICAYLGDGEVAVLKASNTRNLLRWAARHPTQDQPEAGWANLAALRHASEDLLASIQGSLHTAINVGVGRYYPGIHGLARSYQDARAALRLGRHFHGHNRVHCLDGLGVVAFVGLSDERTKVELAASLLSPLDHEPELIKTLDQFFYQDCCPSTTAAALSIHRNTLGYRLDKIAALIGLDPRRFDDAVQIRLALILRSLRRTGSEEPIRELR